MALGLSSSLKPGLRRRKTGVPQAALCLECWLLERTQDTPTRLNPQRTRNVLSGQAAGEQGGWSVFSESSVLRDPGKGPQGWHEADIMGLDGQGHWGVHEPNGASPRSSQRCRVVEFMSFFLALLPMLLTKASCHTRTRRCLWDMMQ